MKKGSYILFTVALTTICYGQKEQIQKDSIKTEYILIDGDSVLRKTIELDEVYIFNKLKFNSYNDKAKYYILRKKTLKVYPYAKLAAERLTELNQRLAAIESKSKRRKYTKTIQKYIEEEFSAELKKLTRTEGQILVKLIHRQTGKTAFNLVKELRSGWRAFWYNNTAKMFKISIKEEYHPETVHEDYLIEEILQRAFASGEIQKQPSSLNFDYTSLSNKWQRSKIN